MKTLFLILLPFVSYCQIQAVVATANAHSSTVNAELLSSVVNQQTSNVLGLYFGSDVTIATNNWSIDSDGSAISILDVIADNETDTPKFLLDRAVVVGENLTVSYSGGSGIAPVIDLEVTNNVHILLRVDFGGSTVQTEKGTITNPNASDLTISQTDGLRFTRTTDNSVGTLTNYWQTVDNFNRGVFSYSIVRNTGYTASIWVSRLIVDDNNYISLQKRSASGSIVRLVVVVGGSAVYDFETALSPGSYLVKISYESDNDIRFYYWDGSAWVQLGTTQNANIGSSLKLQFTSLSSASDAANHRFIFSDVRVCDQDYTTIYPEDYFK